MNDYDGPLKDPKGGLTAAGRKAYNADGGNLKPGVKSYESASVEDKKRWINWALRFYGQKKCPPVKKPNGEPTRYALMATAWGEPVPETMADAKAIAEKARKRKADIEGDITKRADGRDYTIPSPLSSPKEIVGSHGHRPAGTSVRWPAMYRELRKKGYSKRKSAMISNGKWRKKHGLPPKSRGVVEMAKSYNIKRYEAISKEGTTAGAIKGWITRKRGGKSTTYMDLDGMGPDKGRTITIHDMPSGFVVTDDTDGKSSAGGAKMSKTLSGAKSLGSKMAGKQSVSASPASAKPKPVARKKPAAKKPAMPKPMIRNDLHGIPEDDPRSSNYIRNEKGTGPSRLKTSDIKDRYHRSARQAVNDPAYIAPAEDLLKELKTRGVDTSGMPPIPSRTAAKKPAAKKTDAQKAADYKAGLIPLPARHSRSKSNAQVERYYRNAVLKGETDKSYIPVAEEALAEMTIRGIDTSELPPIPSRTAVTRKLKPYKAPTKFRDPAAMKAAKQRAAAGRKPQSRDAQIAEIMNTTDPSTARAIVQELSPIIASGEKVADQKGQDYDLASKMYVANARGSYGDDITVVSSSAMIGMTGGMHEVMITDQLEYSDGSRNDQQLVAGRFSTRAKAEAVKKKYTTTAPRKKASTSKKPAAKSGQRELAWEARIDPVTGVPSMVAVDPKTLPKPKTGKKPANLGPVTSKANTRLKKKGLRSRVMPSDIERVARAYSPDQTDIDERIKNMTHHLNSGRTSAYREFVQELQETGDMNTALEWVATIPGGASKLTIA